MTDNSDRALIEALRAAGHPGVADHLRNEALAGELTAAGRPDLAEQLTGEHPSTPDAAQAATPDGPEAEQAAGQALLAHLNRSTTTWTED